MLYSPLDAVRLAQKMRKRQVVFFAVGFETTAPPSPAPSSRPSGSTCRTFRSSSRTSSSRPPWRRSSPPACRVQGFLAAGHVCTVMGTTSTSRSPRSTGSDRRHRIRAARLMVGIRMTLAPRGGRYGLEIQYSRCVHTPATSPAEAPLRGLRDVRQAVARHRVIPKSGYALTPRFLRFDAARRFDVETVTAEEPAVCIGRVDPPGAGQAARCAASARSAGRRSRSARRWSLPRGPARPTTPTAAIEDRAAR